MSKILIIGSANADLTIHTDRMPKLGETLMGHGFSVNCGGKGANQAVAVAKLGGNAEFIGAVGNDAYGGMLIRNLEANGVDFIGTVAEDTPTGTASITVVNGDNFIILNEGANGLMTANAIKKAKSNIENADYLIMQLEIPVEGVLEAARIAKESGTKVIVNPAPCKELPNELFGLTDYIIPNEHEAFLLTGIDPENAENCKKAVEFLLAKGAKNVIITLGADGCVCGNGEKTIRYPAVKANVVDTTSAGDSFIGALVTKLANGDNVEDAIGFATKVAAITVSRPGASDSIPLANEIE